MRARPRGRKADPTIDTAIAEAVIKLLFERGFEMTFDEVAAEAGVGRATIFRRFDTKRDMILSAVSRLSLERVNPPDTGSLRGDLHALITSVMQVFGDARISALARRFQGEACRDDAFADLLRENIQRRLELITGVLARSVERGELSPETDVKLLADLISGIVAIRLATATLLPDAAEIDRLTGLLIDGISRPSTRRGELGI